MQMRFILPVAAVALALGAASESSAQGSSSDRVIPAQMPQPSPCDEYLRAVDIEMPGAVGLRVAAAQRNVSRAEELCNSGHPEQGVPILRGVLNSLHEGG